MMQKHDFADMMRYQRQTQWEYFKGRRRECIYFGGGLSQSCSRYTDNGCDNGPLALPFVLFSKIESKYFTAIFHLHVSLVDLTL